MERREAKGKGEKERYMYLNAEFQRLTRRDKKALLSDHCKETEENNKMGKTRDLFKKMRNRFKGLDLIECLMNYGLKFLTLYRRQGSRLSPWKRNAKKQNGCLRRPYK